MNLTWNDLARYAAAVLVDERDVAEIGAQAAKLAADNAVGTFDDLMNALGLKERENAHDAV